MARGQKRKKSRIGVLFKIFAQVLSPILLLGWRMENNPSGYFLSLLSIFLKSRKPL